MLSKYLEELQQTTEVQCVYQKLGDALKTMIKVQGETPTLVMGGGTGYGACFYELTPGVGLKRDRARQGFQVLLINECSSFPGI